MKSINLMDCVCILGLSRVVDSNIALSKQKLAKVNNSR